MSTPPAEGPLTASRLRWSSLRQGGPTRFRLEPDAAGRAALARELGAESLRKLRFDGVLLPRGKAGWRLEARLGATAVQACIVTLEPVTTRIDTEVVREFVPSDRMEPPEPGSEIEMPENDTVDPMGDEVDLAEVMAEALALELPAYPRKDGAELGSAQFAEDGTAPITDEEVKPFAGLAALKQKMQDGGEDD
ncbi:YceD family protein [Maliponia aquimaris]|uniref:DUF177 domain-containing protein n=1 Tax=Maliponia aquimaris TaxID=1673631 RepID=A0A238KT81_9RHOB|nr:DUF177 domain-containing protein [Maliponia aquimaris]SMX45236.1 hypothetical protein MAA8898_03174 [Maliponia aquimaris]